MKSDRLAGMGVILALFVAATAAFGQWHADLRVAHGVVVYLLLILGAAAMTGRVFTFAIVFASYLAVDWLFIPPIGQFGSPRALDGILLAAFFCVGLAASELVHQLRAARDEALARAREVEALGVEGRRLAAEVARADSLREADQVKNALLASIAHDLRLPLTTIREMAAGREPAGQIVEQTERMTGYLDALLQFVRADGLLGPRLEANVGEDLVGAAVRAARGALGEHEVIVRLPRGGGVLLGDFDFALALRALQNLLENAARYSPPRTPIEVELEERDGRLHVRVLDRGPGIPPGEVERLFRPLERGGSAAPGGTGLGLAIARTFARAQGGDVGYASREGGGSVFTLELRSRRGEVPAVPRTEPSVRDADLHEVVVEHRPVAQVGHPL